MFAKLGSYTKYILTNTYSPNDRFLVQETFPKTLPRFVLILISLQRWQHRAQRNQAFCVTTSDWSPITSA